jgi:hypothetical protein
MDHRIHEICSAGSKRQENIFPETYSYASSALKKQSNLNCNSKMLALYKCITDLNFCRKLCDYFAHIQIINILVI